MKAATNNRWNSAAWLGLTLCAIVLLLAGMSRKNEKICKGINVELSGAEDHFFVEEKELEKLLNANGNLAGRPIETINLLVMEQRLENDKWIRNAELFFDNNQVLQAVVEEREPIARIFTTGGYSYYIDSNCHKLPLSDKLSARVPMFTNFPSNRTRLGRADSTLLVALKDLAVYINSVPFWKAQVAQVHITATRELEIVPTIGNHTVMLGRPEDIPEKFNRLFTFYKQVWTRLGVEKYDRIDVQFSNQVVATHRGTGGATYVDSAKARVALDALMAQKRMTADTEPGNAPAQPRADIVVQAKHTIDQQQQQPVNNVTSGNKKIEEKKASNVTQLPKKPAEQQATPVSKKAVQKTAPAKGATQNGAAVQKKPKAVMQKKTAPG